MEKNGFLYAEIVAHFEMKCFSLGIGLKQDNAALGWWVYQHGRRGFLDDKWLKAMTGPAGSDVLRAIALKPIAEEVSA